jgi:pyruvate dehydrogenase E2 component (dihydrolipoamide acetyltransferase)
MARTAREVPQFVQQISVDAAALVARLKRVRYEGTHVTYTDLLVHSIAHAAMEVTEVNASFGNGEIIRYADVNVSVAMATDRGLVVPVVHRATELSLAEVAASTKHLAELARAGRLNLDHLSGGTISLSNLGAFGIDTGFPIVNAPQCALVFVGRLGQEPVVVDGRIEVGTRLQLAVAFDHRVVDGMTAARFTQALRARIENGG